MPLGGRNKKLKIGAIVVLVIFVVAVYLEDQLGPLAAAGAQSQVFSVGAGESFRSIVSRLVGEHLIRSRPSFEVLSLFTGSATKLKPGVYKLSPAMSSREILSELVLGSHREVTVIIPGGSSLYDIDKILSGAGVSEPGSFINFGKTTKIEGRLFPDTYKFFLGSETKEAVDKFLENFRAKAEPLFLEDNNKEEENLILASLIEKEVPGDDDRKIVAGIFKKRLRVGMPLQVDASVCYAKRILAPTGSFSCYPLTPLDFKIVSPYNTYLYGGLPSGPVGSPGISAIKAVLESKSTEYWYYLSDPKTKKTIFAKTLDEHSKNRAKYLGP